MHPLRYSINVTLDGCCDHTAVVPDEGLHHYAAEIIARADALLFGRVTYRMMESAWRLPHGAVVVGGAAWMQPFARTIDAAKKYVVSSTIPSVDWNAELVRGDLASAVRELKQRTSVCVGGVTLPLALAELGLIDEYEFIVHPRVVGRGPAIFAGLSRPLDLKLIGRHELPSGAIAMKYVPSRS